MTHRRIKMRKELGLLALVTLGIWMWSTRKAPQVLAAASQGGITTLPAAKLLLADPAVDDNTKQVLKNAVTQQMVRVFLYTDLQQRDEIIPWLKSMGAIINVLGWVPAGTGGSTPNVTYSMPAGYIDVSITVEDLAALTSKFVIYSVQSWYGSGGIKGGYEVLPHVKALWPGWVNTIRHSIYGPPLAWWIEDYPEGPGYYTISPQYGHTPDTWVE